MALKSILVDIVTANQRQRNVLEKYSSKEDRSEEESKQKNTVKSRKITKNIKKKNYHKQHLPKLSRRRTSQNITYPAPAIPVTMTADYYRFSSIQGYSCINDWNPIITNIPIPIPHAIYSVPLSSVPVTVVNPPQIVLTQVCPYAGAIIAVSPILPQPSFTPTLPSIDLPTPYYTDPFINFYDQIEVAPNDFDNSNLKQHMLHEDILVNTTEDQNVCDPLDCYLTLSKELFPTAKMLAVDPNPIIEEFCKLLNIHTHAPWILDLEFGIPRKPVTRQIAAYNVQYNSVNCKNIPNAIHPAFESCDQDFKTVVMFYYDCIFSAWYRGYIFLNNDTSVANFQSWLQLPMQVFGMCWP